MRLTAWAVAVIFALTSCGASSVPPPPPPSTVTLPTLTLTAPPEHLLSFDDAAPLAYDGANPVVPLFAVPNIATNQGTLSLTFWGTKDANGRIEQITEAGIGGLSAPVHVFFDASGRPVYLREDGSGYALALSYASTTQQTVTLCDPSDAAIASAQLALVNGTFESGPAYDGGGSCEAAGALAAARSPHAAFTSTGVYTDLSNLSSLPLAKLITAASYIAGLGFSIGAIMKFKQHKDNPTQIPIGTPIALVFIAAALLFVPTILSAVNATIYDPYAATAAADDLVAYIPEDAILGCASRATSCPFPSPEPTP